MKELNCIIIDDEEIDRLSIISHVKKFRQFIIKGVYENANEIAPTDLNDIQVAFLDIDMPEISGLEFRKKYNNIPVCIFITAHPEHAAESFELDTLDFIVKPVKNDRFQRTVSRIDEFFEVKDKAALFEKSIGGDTIYIKEGHEQTKIKLQDILYLEALKDYTLLVTNKKRHCVLSNLGTLLKENHFKSFVRVHRSFAVQKNYINKILPNELIINENHVIPIGRSYKENIIL